MFATLLPLLVTKAVYSDYSRLLATWQ